MGARTADTRIASAPDLTGYVVTCWCARLGSNQQPLPSEGSTLSIELRTQRREFYQRAFAVSGFARVSGL
jgi:hypothetical protein